MSSIIPAIWNSNCYSYCKKNWHDKTLRLYCKSYNCGLCNGETVDINIKYKVLMS